MMGADQKRTQLVNQESGNTTANIGLLPLLKDDHVVPPHSYSKGSEQFWRVVPREGCHAQFDTTGRHRASCARSGRVKKRATPPERITGRILREAGAIVRQNV